MRAALAALMLPAAFAYTNGVTGHDNCRCKGDNNAIPDGQQLKELGYGTDCRPWDEGMGYCTSEKSGNGYTTGNEWCGLAWCYVDRATCNSNFDNGNGVTLLMEADGDPTSDLLFDQDPLVQQSVIYPTTELYFSYNTCGVYYDFGASGTVWVWDFGECEPRTPNDYYLLVDGSKSVINDWDNVKETLKTILDEGLNHNITKPWGDRVGMVEFSGKRAFGIADTLTIFNFKDSRADAISAIDGMNNLEGQTWTLMGLQKTIEAFNAEEDAPVNPDEPEAVRNKILLLITDGRPKPRNVASSADNDAPEPGCIVTMVDDTLPTCENGKDPSPGVCRNLWCGDVDMSKTDCCPGEQNPCAAPAEELNALIKSLQDNEITVAVIAVGADVGIKSEPYNCNPDGCTPGSSTEDCVCEYDVYYFDCLLKPDYDQSAEPVAHRISLIEDFESFFQYKDPTASKEGGTDGQICIDPKLLLPPAPPTSSCTEIPEPKDVVLVLDSSKSMFTTRTRGGTAKGNWLTVMRQLQDVVCLYNSAADPSNHRCAFTSRDNVGFVRFATLVTSEWDFNYEGFWWSNIVFTKFEGGEEVAAMDRTELKYMTDTVAGLWEAFTMMDKMDASNIILQDGKPRAKRREIILITDGRPHCKDDTVSDCRPCGLAWKDETVQKFNSADADLKIIWKGDRTTHDGNIAVDKDQLAQDDWFGCLDVDFDDPEQFIVIEDFDDDTFRTGLMGTTLVCAQDN